jgi:hypothetical protein
MRRHQAKTQRPSVCGGEAGRCPSVAERHDPAAVRLWRRGWLLKPFSASKQLQRGLDPLAACSDSSMTSRTFRAKIKKLPLSGSSSSSTKGKAKKPANKAVPACSLKVSSPSDTSMPRYSPSLSIDESFGDRLAKLRHAAGLSQRKLEAASGSATP